MRKTDPLRHLRREALFWIVAIVVGVVVFQWL